jgi:5'-3' exonuclease
MCLKVKIKKGWNFKKSENNNKKFLFFSQKIWMKFSGKKVCSFDTKFKIKRERFLQKLKAKSKPKHFQKTFYIFPWPVSSKSA